MPSVLSVDPGTGAVFGQLKGPIRSTEDALEILDVTISFTETRDI
ncbi:unnamed protein product [Ectocarpus sp. 6 AP-2014]